MTDATLLCICGDTLINHAAGAGRCLVRHDRKNTDGCDKFWRADEQPGPTPKDFYKRQRELRKEWGQR